MNTSVAATFLLIVVARITDMTVDTIRTASIVQGRRVFSAMLGFFQALIYILAIAKVLLNIEQRLAFVLQVASLFTKKGAELAKALILAGYRLAKVEGHSRDGSLTIVYVEVPRKQAPKLIHDAGVIDETCFCITNDVRIAGFAARPVNLNVKSQKQPGVAEHHG